MPLSVEDYRSKASECDLMASQTTDQAAKAAYQEMAQAWRQLADRSDWLAHHRPELPPGSAGNRNV